MQTDIENILRNNYWKLDKIEIDSDDELIYTILNNSEISIKNIKSLVIQKELMIVEFIDGTFRHVLNYANKLGFIHESIGRENYDVFNCVILYEANLNE